MKKLLNKTMTCISKRLLHVTLLCFMLLGFSGVAWGATITGGTKLYLKPNSAWKTDNARFAMYLFGGSSGEKWYSMSDGNSDGVYSATIGSGESYEKVIFCRMDPNVQNNCWDGCRWNQTGDLVWDGANDMAVISGDNAGSPSVSWSKYSASPDPEPDPTPIPDIKCDPENTKVLFTETFGTFANNDDRDSYSRNLANHGYVARVPSNYSAMTTKCTAIKDKGYYAVVANPFWGGCGTQGQGDTYACNCNSDWWYQDITDHTEGDTNGGMLMYNCNDGTSTTDVLYECELDVCADTYINFLAYIAPANALRDCDAYQDAGVKFVLKETSTGTQIATKTIKDIKLDAGWQPVSVMFKSGESQSQTKKLTLQFINIAVDGNCGNDLLIDDITLSVCTPKANLKTSNGTTSSTIVLGQTETLTAEITSGIMDDPYYLWQVKDIRTGAWVNLIDEPVKDKASFEVTPNAPSLEYRVIIAPNIANINKALANVNADVCGMYAITNTATITANPIKIEIDNPSAICIGDRGKFTITATNPLGKAISNVKIRIVPPTNMESSPIVSPSSTYNNKVWTIASLPAGTSTFTYEAESTGIGKLTFQAYISAVGNLTYTSYDDVELPAESKAITNIDVERITFTKNPLNVEDACEESRVELTATAESSCEGNVTYQWVRRTKGTQGDFTPISGAINSTYVIESLTSTDAKYEYAVWANVSGCPCKNVQSNVVTIDFVEKTAKPSGYNNYMECQTEGKQSLSALFEETQWTPSKLTFYKYPTGDETITEFDKNVSGQTTYYFTYKEDNKCESDRATLNVQILPTPVATITSDKEQKICTAENTQKFTVTADAKNGSGKWEITKVVNEEGVVLDNSVVSISSLIASVTTITLPKGTVATITWRVTSPGEKCDATAVTTLTAYEKPVLAFDNNEGTQAKCATSDFTVSVGNHAGTGSWTIVGAANGAKIQSPNSRSTQVIGLEPGKTVELKYTATNGNCEAVETTCTLTNEVCNKLSWEEISASPAVVCLNAEVILTFVVNNGSTVATTGVEADIKLPSGLTFVGVESKTAGDYNNGTWKIGDLEVGKGATLKIKVEATGVGDNETIATITKASSSTLNVEKSVTVKVNALPTATFEAATSEICASARELSAIKVNFTGATPYDLSYTYNGENQTANDVLTPYFIKDALDVVGEHTYKLTSVTDANGCSATITGQQHKVTVDKYPELGDIESVKDICDNGTLTLPSVPTINWNGSTEVSQGWILGGVSIDANKHLPAEDYNGKQLQYTVTAKCASTATTVSTDTEIFVTVDKNPSPAVINLEEIQQCNNNVFTVSAEPITIGTGTWTVSPRAGIVNAGTSEATITVEEAAFDKQYIATYKVENGACPSVSDEVKLTYNNCTAIEIEPVGEGPAVCNGSLATFEFTLTNNSVLTVKDVTLELVLGDGLELQNATASSYSFIEGKCVIPSMSADQKISVQVQAKATVDDAKVTIKVIKSSNQDVTGVEASQAVTVYSIPTAAFDATNSVICASESENTAIKVNFTGAPNYNLTYTVDGETKNATSVSNPYTIKESLTGVGSYSIKLVSVTDKNGCVGTIKDQEHTTKVEKYAALSNISDVDPICEESAVDLPTEPTVYENGSKVSDRKWMLDGTVIDANTTIPYTKEEQELWYQVGSTCATYTKTIPSNKVTLKVDRKPTIANAGPDQTQCNNGEFVMAANTPQLGSGKWSVVGSSVLNYEEENATTTVTGVPETESVELTWTISSKLGACRASTDNVILTNNNCTNFELKAVGEPSEVCPNGEAEFNFTLKNTATVDVEDVKLNLTFETGLTLVSAKVESLPFETDNTITIKELKAGASVSIQVKATADATANGKNVSITLVESSGVPVGLTVSQKVVVNQNPVVTNIKSYTGEDPTKPKVEESKVITCTNPVLYLHPTIESENEVSYTWTPNSTSKINPVRAEGTYTLKVVDNVTGCESEEKSIDITENKVYPVLEKVISTTKVIVEGESYEEVNVLDCNNQSLILNPVIKDQSGMPFTRDLEFVWSKVDENGNVIAQGGTGKTETVTTEGFYTLQIIDAETGCPGELKTIEIKKETSKPVINNIISYTRESANDPERVESKVLTCTNPILYLNPEIESVNEVSYLWSTGSTEKVLKVEYEGTYTLVATDTKTGCSTDAVKCEITENKRTPIIEDIISVNSTDETVEGYKETQIINCKDTELFISSVIKDNVDVKYSPEELEYNWTVSYDDGVTYTVYGETETISTTKEVIFSLVVTDIETGCPAVADSIHIKELKTTPVITSVTSSSVIDPEAAGAVLTNVLTCSIPELYLIPNIDDSEGNEYENSVSYKWNDGSENNYLKVNEEGTYTVIVTDNTTFCSAEEFAYDITENKRTPIIEDIISATSLDETAEGYKETQIINCKDTELFISSVIKDKVDKQYSTEELKYDWTVSYDDGEIFEEYGEAATITTTKEAIFKLVVTDKLTGCPAEAKTIEITEVKTTPVIKSITSTSTIDPSAEGAVETNVLTCEVPVLFLNPIIESENEVSYKWNDGSTNAYYKVDKEGTYTVIVTDNTTFCSTTEYPYEIDENKNAPKLTLKAVYELCPSDVSVDMTLSSLLPNTEGITYTFYDEAGDELEDLYAIPTESETTTYFVVGTSANGCPSEKAKFTVDFAQNVDFTLTASQTSMLVGGNETVIEVIPANGSDVNAIYQWTANDEDLIVDGLQYVDNLYLDTNFKVTGSNRCNSVTKEAFVEVLWPTAFTPHNNNGLNETFAKGMKLVVFNRFYTKIFEGEDGWDGTINGTMNESETSAVPGVYYYAVQLPNGQVKKGTIEIVKVD